MWRRPNSKKKREGKPKESVASLRQFVRNPTRRRFFAQCCDPNSLLWSDTPSGNETMHMLLFNAAAQSPMNIVYNDHPGPTHTVKSTQMLKIIKWQVRKDRANYRGKPPKRQICFGSPLPFDCTGTLAEINSSFNIYYTNSHSHKVATRLVLGVFVYILK